MCGVFGDNRSVRISPASSSIMHATTERAWTSRPTHIRSDSTGASRKCGTTTPAWRRPAPTYERGAGPTYGLGLQHLVPFPDPVGADHPVLQERVARHELLRG